MNELLEYLGTALGLIYLLLAIREQRTCWIAGALASAVFFFVFLRSGLPAQALLQVYYIAIAVHGWIVWGRVDDRILVSRLTIRHHASLVGLWILLGVGTVAVAGQFLNAVAWFDSLTSWGGVLATWLVARKFLDAWIYWVVIDTASALLYLSQDLRATAVLYGVYTALAAVAWHEWRQSSANSRTS
ncbi:MAG: nicotinamide riboside transporter PnuC [Pseudomonadota bacterium]